MPQKPKEYDNTNKGTLFLIEDKASEKHPDFNGYLNIDGVEHWLSGWKKISKDGETKFVSLSLGEVRNSPVKKGKEKAKKEVDF